MNTIFTVIKRSSSSLVQRCKQRHDILSILNDIYKQKNGDKYGLIKSFLAVVVLKSQIWLRFLYGSKGWFMRKRLWIFVCGFFWVGLSNLIK
ncbi:hypothetical protein CVS40_7032 [Lucilia cuprina]|nr:hypothetical protein CVS40_7032 [Lucilia cuprina]